MAFVVTGVVTNKGRETFAKSMGSIGGFTLTRAYKFRIGMGGYITTLAGRVPKVPDPSKTIIEATGAPGDAYFEKLFGSTDFQFIVPSTIQIRCRLDPTEFNDDGLGNAPRLFEIGIFDDYNNLLVYATFDEETKAPTKVLTNFIQVIF